MFTKILKFVLWLYIIAGVVLSIVSVVEWDNDWWSASLGILITFISASLIGTFVEISEHTQETNELLYKLANLRDAPQKD